MVSGRARGAFVAGVLPVVALGTLITGIGRPATVSVHSAGALMTVPRHYGQPGNFSGYSAIAITGRHAAWVFGGTNPGGSSAPVAAHWNGAKLQPASLPAGLTGFMSAASASSASDVWAVSEYGMYALRWTGRSWQVAKRWHQGEITGVAAIDPRDVWVFGTPLNGVPGIGTWHFNGHSWAQAGGPAARIYQASSWRGDIWAVVADRHSDHIERFNGRSWQRVRTATALNGIQPASIVAVSNWDVWVVGNTSGKARPGRLVLAHWNGRSWQRLTTTMHAFAGPLAAGRRGGVLVTATPVSSPESGKILEVSTSGRVSAISVGSRLGSGVSDVALAQDSQSIWATGGDLTQVGSDAALWVVPVHRDQHRNRG